jgi:hypothetical protein
MDTLGDWLSDIDDSLGTLGREVSLDILTGAGVALSHTVATHGYPGVLPLWSGELQTVGLLADPAAVPTTWRAVVLARRHGLTLATDARTLLPQLIVHRVLSKLPVTAERLADRWNKIQPKVLALHRTLGGSDEPLDTVIAAVRDPQSRGQFTPRVGREAEFERAHSALARRIDNSEPFVRYADWLDACIETRWIAPDSAERYGPWGRRVLCWARRLRYRQPEVLTLPVSSVRRVIEEEAGIDSGVPKQASWAARPGGASGETALVEAARSIASVPSSGDPVGDGLVKALLTEGTAYKGYAHAEAVVALEERGEPERAWKVLQSAAWWAARNTGQVPGAMLQGARFMADRHGWADVRWVVERAVAAQST